ncbi:MAG: ribose 5-phosphate isomerase B [Patescibacteria group bacterium]|nr:ribose 5-phosphate isomerase B [Patescibacteria group bacterium]
MTKKEIAIASDHGGYELKQKLISYLKNKRYKIQDLGTKSAQKRVDYPEYAARVALAISSGAFSQGILICSSGVGMSIAANRFPNVRASLCYNPKIAQHTRKHNFSNILCLGAQFTDAPNAQKITRAWLKTPPSREKRHKKRVSMIEEINFPRCPGCF